MGFQKNVNLTTFIDYSKKYFMFYINVVKKNIWHFLNILRVNIF